MKKSSVPSPFYSSTISEEKAEHTHFRGRNDNIRAARSQVTEKKSPETASNINNKLESQPSMDINESADAFIKNFRQQLRIQRLESIENYEQMLARGDGVDQSCEHASPRAWIIPGSERYSFEPISTEESISDYGRLYKGKIFQCKKDLKRTLHMYALKEQFEIWIRRSSKTRYEARCKDGECEFQLRAFKMQKGEY
ncbi:hypothetical protein Dsin_013395 [Dipteronia sinensis]|uniref:Transposase MuDR plant domain-containing protein n=1 Tax=Dipteronia sinensis TaxID=43782 RepID=A0AAE0AKP4_9ROSI|nr:hypothetical protein Dsin_013395 [Dipteronia sinensis]